MKTLKGEIISNEKYGPDVYKMEVFSPYIVKNALPGQFVMVRCAREDVLDPLLRRPISIFNTEKSFKVFSLLYLIKGRGTEYLSRLKKGDMLDFVGPLGKECKLDHKSHMQHLLIGGGIGIAPLYMIAKQLLQNGCDVFFIAGFRDSPYYGFDKDLINLGIHHQIYCEKDASRNIGLATDYLVENIAKLGKSRIYCCGPKQMLIKIQDILKDKDIKAIGLLEEVMACGIGVCKGCAVKVKEKDGFGYKNVCSEGPSFDLKEVIF